MTPEKKLIKFIASLTLISSVFTLFSPSQVQAEEPDQKSEIFQEYERTDLRTDTTKTFQVGVNSFRIETYTDKIHYGAPGNYYDVNNNIILESSGEYEYRNAANDFTFRAGDKLSEGVEYSGYGTFCSFRLESIEGVSLNDVSPVVEENRIIYREIYPSADLEFTVTNTGLKTEVVAKSQSALKPEIGFELINCDPKVFLHPTMSDDIDVASVHQETRDEEIVVSEEQVQVEIKEEQEKREKGLDDFIDNPHGIITPTPKYEVKTIKHTKTIKKLVLKPDYNLLGQINGEVRIDPTIDINLSPSTDVFVSQMCPGNTRRFLGVGDWTDSATTIPCGRAEAYLKFDLGGIPSGAIINQANFSLYRYQTDYGSFTATVRRITQAGLNDSTGSVNGAYLASTGSYASQVITSGSYDFREFIFGITSLVSEWVNSTSPNYGLAVVGNSPSGSNRGAAFCSTRNGDGFCANSARPKLVVTYSLNQPPNTPGLVNPTSLSEISGNCDQSAMPITGNCSGTNSIKFDLNGVGDPDGPAGSQYGLKETYIDFAVGGTQVLSSGPITGEGNISWTGNIPDGVYTWKARSVDGQGYWGNYSAEFTFITDTTPPVIPTVNTLPEYTKGVGIDDTIQVEVNANKTTDNVYSESDIWYILEYSNTSDFSSNVFYKPWQQDNVRFEIGPKGADGIAGNGDDLRDGETYYFRVKAKDKINNISNWSGIVSTTIDGTRPVINNFTASESRFSPNNATSLGIKDSTEFKVNYVEKNPLKASVRIYSGAGKINLVKTIDKDISSNQGNTNPIDVVFDAWNGDDDSNNFLSDGAYEAYVTIYDKAGNEQESNAFLVIVDNSGANITLSFPIENLWTKDPTKPIRGQATAPNLPDREDGDLDKVEIRNISNSAWSNVVHDSLGIFETIVDLNLGKNTFELKTTDTVGNAETIQRTINRESTPPVISGIEPNSLIKERKPSIKFTVTDPDPTSDGSQRSDIAMGTNSENMKLWLTYPILDTSKPKPYPTITATKLLIDQGDNKEPTLISDLICTPAIGAIESVKNNNPSANQINCNLSFISELQPDSTYTIHIQTQDNAENITLKEDVNFTLDSHIYSEIYNPSNGSMYSTSSVLFKGRSSKNSEIRINNVNLAITKSFILNEALNGIGKDNESDPNRLIASNFVITCGEYINVDSREDTPDEEVCSWEVRIYQKYENAPVETENTTLIALTDAAGNFIVHTSIFKVNLYSFNLNVSSDLQYFSPNGDGNQDNIKFTHTATNETDPNAQPEIKNYELKIYRLKVGTGEQQLVKVFSGEGNLPLNSFWDGKSCEDLAVSQLEKISGFTSNALKSISASALAACDYIPDGEYFFTLTVTTTDNAVLTTQEQKIVAKTTLIDEVVITNPKTGYVTTNGVITVQGQGPKPQDTEGQLNPLRGKVFIDICVDTVGTPVGCDMTETVETDENGFFSTLIILPRLAQAQTFHHITAKARDSFGNSTLNSNMVEVIQDTIDPFKKVTITPALTGINTVEEYQRFLNGEISINQLKTLVLSAELTENTEKLQYSFANYTNISARPDNPDYRFISTVNNTIEDDARLNPYNLSSIKKNYNKPIADTSIPSANCDASSCLWETYLPVGSDWGGIYEVEFKAKKGDVIQSLYASFKADGNIPAAPIIMVVEKWDEGKNTWVNLDQFDGKYYTNKTKLRLRGAAEPNINLELSINGAVQPAFTSSAFGIWEHVFDFTGNLSDLIGCKAYVDNRCVLAEFAFDLLAYRQSTDGIKTNQVKALNPVYVIYDFIKPELTKVERKTPDKTITGWVQTGMPAQYTVESNEKIKYSDVIKEDGFVRLLKNSSGNIWLGEFNADRPEEGYYYPTIRLMDLAGNIGEFKSDVYNSESAVNGIPDWRLYIDNTKPNEPFIDKSGWGIDNGIKADGVLPESGRTNPEFVIKTNSVVIKGKAEKDQRVEVFVNNTLNSTINVSNDNCSVIEEFAAKVSANGLLVQDNITCEYLFTYSFPENGENDQFGVPLNSFVFQVRVLDKAANQSTITKQEVIYHDKVSPSNPQILNIKSASYDPIVDWSNRGEITPITKDIEITVDSFAERLADMEYFMLNPSGGQNEYKFFQNTSDRKATQNFKLETANYKDGKRDEERDGCVKTEGNRRVGSCNDGIYKLQLKATDAAGNPSGQIEERIERDTVRPDKSGLEFIVDKDNHILKASIKGESSAVAVVKLMSSSINRNFEYGLNGSGDLYLRDLIGIYQPSTKYTLEVRIRDRAGNMGEATIRSVTTPEDGFCYGNSDGSLLFYPLKGNYVESSSGGFYAMRGKNYHHAQDFTYNDLNYPGDQAYRKPVYAAADGIVTASYDGKHYYETSSPGNSGIHIRHDKKGLITQYIHVEDLWVGYNDPITAGQEIGTVGNKGTVGPAPQFKDDSRGAHLHFMVGLINPNSYTQYTRRSDRDANGNYTPHRGTVFIDPMQVLKLKCVGKPGSGSGEDKPNYGRDSVNQQDAEDIVARFVRDNLQDVSQLESNKGGNQVYISKGQLGDGKNDIDTIKKNLDVFQLDCGVWMQHLGKVVKNGESLWEISTDGAIFVNPINKNAYLVRGKIWKKYYDSGGGCSQIGIPKSEQASAGIRSISRIDGRKVTSAKYQRFQTLKYEMNSIYWYEATWHEDSGCFLIWCNKREDKSIEKAHYVIGQVANTYEKNEGTWSRLSFPIDDTNVNNSSQNFEQGDIKEDNIFGIRHDNIKTDGTEDKKLLESAIHLICDSGEISNISANDVNRDQICDSIKNYAKAIGFYDANADGNKNILGGYDKRSIGLDDSLRTTNIDYQGTILFHEGQHANWDKRKRGGLLDNEFTSYKLQALFLQEVKFRIYSDNSAPEPASDFMGSSVSSLFRFEGDLNEGKGLQIKMRDDGGKDGIYNFVCKSYYTHLTDSEKNRCKDNYGYVE